MADLGNRANVNSAIDLLLDDLQPDEAIQPSDHNVLLKDILDTLANGLSTVLRTGNTTDGQNLTITSSSIFQFANGSNGRLQSDTLTAFRNWTLPDATGTIALIGDVFTAGSGITENAGQIDLGGTLTIDAIINGAGNRTLKLGTNVLNENLSILEKNSIQAFERYANSFPFVNSGLEITKNPGNFIGNLKSSATDYVQFHLTSDEFLVNSILGTNNLAHQSSSTLSQTIVSDTSGGTSSRLELYGSGRVNLGTSGSVGASIVLDSLNTFTDRNTTAKGLEYALDYSANYTDRSLVDKAFVLANAGGDSIYTADGTLTGNRIVDLGGNDLSFKNSSTTNSLLTLSDNAFGEISNTSSGLYLDWNSTSELYLGNSKINNKTGNFTVSNYSGTNTSLDISPNASGLIKIDNSVGSLLKWGSNSLQMAGSFSQMSMNGISKIYLKNNYTVIGSGATSQIFTETISLQGTTAIKGIGTSGSSALAIYDNDTTPNKLWDFLDNGNISVNQSSSFLLSANKTFKVDGSSNTNQNIFELNGATNAFGTGAITVGAYGNLEIKGTDSTSNFKVLTMLGNDYLTLDGNGNQATLTTKAFSVGTNATTGYKLYQDAGRHEFSRLGVMGANFNLVNSSVQFWEAGMTSRKFIIGGSSLIGTEKISLQDNTLIGGTLDMNNNRILNTIVNPSVQETTSTATFTINADEETTGVLTAIALATTIASPTGTPVQGQKLTFRFKDNGTAQSLTWNAIFRAIGLTLPTTTTANKTIYIGCMYNSTETKWDVIAIKEEV